MNAYDSTKWGILIHGQGTVLACHDFNHAVARCNQLNSTVANIVKPMCTTENHPVVWAVIYPWNQLSLDEHDPTNENWDEPLAG